METKIGSVIDGKYEILKQIGKGGMSVVYLAMDKRLNKQWAVKEIRKTSSGKNDEIVINSLIAEANLMKRLDHPALPRIVDIIDNGETLYVVMDYIEGESLNKILDEYGAQPQELVIEWAKQLCDVLNYLHSQKPPIIYRDMKPANVMLKPEGNLKLIDFGIAREYKEKNLADTTVLGTKGYAPPEQHGSRQTDARSDIYALGMTMHHLLTGVDPRPADYEYAPIRQWNPELSEGLERIIDKCTRLDPEDRYQNCNELLYALEHYEEEEGTYKRKQKNKVRAFAASAVFTVLMLITGIGGQILKIQENNKNYSQKVNISASTPYEEKVQSYLEAIDLYGTNTQAYMKLLDAFEEDEKFDEKESSIFAEKFNRNKNGFDTDSAEYLDLEYKMGRMYFSMYSGGDDTFRTRVLKSYSCFKTIVESGQTDYKNYEIAESYYIIGDFYSNYVVNAASVKEPSGESYEKLLESIRVCMDNLDNYDSDDAAYTRLTMYREISNLLNDHRKGLATTDVDKDTVLQVLDEIARRTKEQAVTQEKSINLQDAILISCTEYKDNIERVYTNTEERTAQTGESSEETAQTTESTEERN